MKRYAKGIAAAIGTAVNAGMIYGGDFCDTWYPALLALFTTVGVIAIPNAKKKEKSV